jgi:exopolysaccharide production protein ExoQ
MNISRRYLGDIFTILVLMLATGALQSLVVDSSTSKAVTEGNLWLQIMWACIYVVVAIRASHQYQAIADVVRANKLLIALVLLTLLSTVWSEDPGLTLRRSVALLATTLFGLDFAVRYSIREQLRLLAIALSGVVVLSVIAQVFFPGSIPSTDVVYPDAWIGLFGQKNEFARIVVLATMVILTAVRRTARGVVTGVLAVIAALGLIFAAQSMTAFVTLGGMLLIFQFAPTLRWNSRIRTAVQFIAAAIVLPALYFLIEKRDAVTEMLGRNSSLTGRVKIWVLSVSAIAVKPILGYGYNAFWNVSPAALQIDAALGWNIPHAHNAFIELALELGLVGLGLCAAVYVVALCRAAVYMRDDRTNRGKWPLIYLCFVMLYSFTENAMLAPNTIFWMIFVAASCSVSQPAGALAVEEDEDIETEPDAAGPSFATS